VASQGFTALPTDVARHTAMLKVLEKADEMSRKLSARQRAIDARDGTQAAGP
jgi:hypothetical protein